MSKLRLVYSITVREVLSNYPDYTLYITKGFAFKGAREFLEDKETKRSLCPGGSRIMTFEERMKQIYDFYVAYYVNIDHENKELHINAFSVNDMY